MGVSIQEVTSELAEALGMEIPKGALVSQIIEDSPAEKSGLKEEDVILFFDGEEIFTPQITFNCGLHKARIKSKRHDTQRWQEDRQVTVGELPKDPALLLRIPNKIS